MANAIVLSQCAMVCGVHITIPSKCLGVYYAIIRNVREQLANHLARHSQQMLQNDQGYCRQKTHLMPYRLNQQ
jgi:hypothetical protein